MLTEPAVVATAIAAAAWLLLLSVLAVATKNPDIDAGPATDELGTESPAIVDLITGGWRLTDEAAVATLLDLAARGVVQIEEIGPELSLVRLRGRADTVLTPYEQQVLDHLTGLSRDGVVATEALAEGARDLGRWWKNFERKVIAEARTMGLSRPRWKRAQLMILSAAALVPAGSAAYAAAVLSPASERGDNAYGAGGGVLLGCAFLVARLRAERGTSAGAQAAGRWLGVRKHLAGNPQFAESPAASVTIWGRHLAYAAALGLAGRAVASLPVSRAADDRRAWSDYGGLWHVVHVDYPRRGLLWGVKPLPALIKVLATGAVLGFIVYGVLLVATELADLPLAPKVGAVLVVAALLGVPLSRTLADLVSRAVVEGQIVRLRTFQTGSEENSSATNWLALDDGHHRQVRAMGLDPVRFSELYEGDVVRVRVARRLGWVHDVEIVTPSRRRGLVAHDC